MKWNEIVTALRRAAKKQWIKNSVPIWKIHNDYSGRFLDAEFSSANDAREYALRCNLNMEHFRIVFGGRRLVG